MPRIKVKFSFLFFNALAFIFRDSALIMGFYGACLIHEAGHIAAIYLTNGSVRSIELSWIGIKITADPPQTVKAAVFVQLSGPLANLAAFLILTINCRTGFLTVFCLIEGLLNLLPYKFLDGGSVLEILAQASGNCERFNHFNNLLRAIVFVTLIILFTCYTTTVNNAISTILTN